MEKYENLREVRYKAICDILEVWDFDNQCLKWIHQGKQLSG